MKNELGGNYKQDVERAEHSKSQAYSQGIQFFTGLMLPEDKCFLQLASIHKAKILSVFKRTLSNNKPRQ